VKSRPQTQTAQRGSSDSTLEKVLKSGLGLSPIVTGLIDLFKGSEAPPPPLLKYALPHSIAFQGAETGDGLTTTDYDQNGMARAYAGPAPPRGPAERVNGGGPLTSAAGSPGQAATHQITVNVQAMDARSFDRGDIALAVREAMLNLDRSMTW
jgi:hypothetical protein